MQKRIVYLSLVAAFLVGCETPVEPEFNSADTNPLQGDAIDQLPILGSSMIALCVPGTSCAQLRFVVDLAGAATKVNVLSLINPSIGQWNWVNAIAVLDGNGNPTGFTTYTVGGVSQVLVAVGPSAVEPLTVIVDATGSTGTQADLAGAFSYVGTAIEEAGGTHTVYEFNGKVVRGDS